MLKRALLVLTVLWAIAFIGNGLTKAGGIGLGDVALAIAPFLVIRTIAWIVTGEIQPRRY